MTRSTRNFADFSVHMYMGDGPFVIFLDNASYHKSKMLQGFLDGMGKRIVVEYFLTYTPELNPTKTREVTEKGHWQPTL